MNVILRNKLVFVLLVAVIVAVTVWLATIEIEGALKEFVVRYGYLGFLTAAFVGGLNLIVPVSHFIFVIPLLNAGLNPWLLVVLGTAGTALADIIGYGLGHSGSRVFPALDKFRLWVEGVTSRYPILAPLVLFGWASFVPLPNEILVIPAGLARYGFLRTLIIVVAGNAVFHILVTQFGGLFIMS